VLVCGGGFAGISAALAAARAGKKVVLFEKFDLPYSYEGLPAGINSFPRLKFTLQGPQQKDRRTGAFKCLALNICKIVIEPYREDSTNE
jgi:flavin-dependent dehydrogenase